MSSIMTAQIVSKVEIKWKLFLRLTIQQELINSYALVQNLALLQSDTFSDQKFADDYLALLLTTKNQVHKFKQDFCGMKTHQMSR